MIRKNTYFNNQEAEAIAIISGREIRKFLNFLTDDKSSDAFSAVPEADAIQKFYESELTLIRKTFIESSDEFRDTSLVAKGLLWESATDHPVRIEVRPSHSIEEGVAQIAARGICGDFRRIALKNFQMDKDLQNIPYHVKMSGSFSFEFNVNGVDKALPLRYLKENWLDVLAAMNYSPGSVLDARQDRVLISADGDGTLYGKPTLEAVPTLKDSPAFEALLRYLRLGGVAIVISGNALNRTQKRIENDLPEDVRNRFIICANGGANMMCYGSNSTFENYNPFSENGLTVLDSSADSQELNWIYIGDDNKVQGNDFTAFDYVGMDRSFLVSQSPSQESPLDQACFVGKLEFGTQRVLHAINESIERGGGSQIFQKEKLDGLRRNLSN